MRQKAKSWWTMGAGALPLIFAAVAFLLLRSLYHQSLLSRLQDINQLKSIQIERQINKRWQRLQEMADTDQSNGERKHYAEGERAVWFHQASEAMHAAEPLLHYVTREGITDLTPLALEGSRLLAYRTQRDSQVIVLFSPVRQIDSILQQATSMPVIGESYLVGPDFRLRSDSRFHPDVAPSVIGAKTSATVRAIDGETGAAMVIDYQDQPAFSAYRPLQVDSLPWGVISEWQKEEVMPGFVWYQRAWILVSLVLLIAGWGCLWFMWRLKP